MNRLLILLLLFIPMNLFSQWYRSNSLGQALEEIPAYRKEEYPYVLFSSAGPPKTDTLYEGDKKLWIKKTRIEEDRKEIVTLDTEGSLVSKEVFAQDGQLISRVEGVKDEDPIHIEYFYNSNGRVSRIRRSQGDQSEETIYLYQGNYLKEVSRIKNGDLSEKTRFFYSPSGELQTDFQLTQDNQYYFQSQTEGIKRILQQNREGLLQKEEQIFYNDQGQIIEKEISFTDGTKHVETYEEGKLVVLKKWADGDLSATHRYYYEGDNLVRERIDSDRIREDYFWEYDSSGTISYKAYKINLIIQWEKWYSLGEVEREVWYKEGKLNLEQIHDEAE